MKSRLVHACRILVTECAHIRRGEEVLLLTDDLQAPILSEAISVAVSQRGGVPISVVYPAIPPYWEPPQTVIHAMKRADVVIAFAIRPIGSEPIEEAREAGARLLSMFRITPDALVRTVPIDYERLKRETRKIQKTLETSGVAEIASPQGTNFRVRMAGRPVRAALGSVRKRGEIDFIPAGAIGVAPLEGTAEGRVVANGTILGFGRCLRPLIFEVEKGRVMSVKGGRQWKGLRELLERDANATCLCEIGLGVNPKAKLVGGPEDERVRGSVHIGLGENRYFGGTLASASHLDATLVGATLTVDGKELVKNGRLLM